MSSRDIMHGFLINPSGTNEGIRLERCAMKLHAGGVCIWEIGGSQSIRKMG